MPSEPAAIAGSVLERARGLPPTLGSGRLICIDGPAGSGKTTLARAIADAMPTTQVVHCDELLHGWAGLPGLASSVSALLAPLAHGEQGQWRRWDWAGDVWAETHDVTPGGLLVLEGVGSWSPQIAALVTMLVWVEAPAELRLVRGLERDGEQMRVRWEQWQVDEHELFARLATRECADLLVTTDG